MISLPRKKRIVIFLVLFATVSLALGGYFYFVKGKFGRDYEKAEIHGVRATVKTEEREYKSIFGTVKDKRDEDIILIENEGEEEWVKINPDSILSSDYEEEGTPNSDGSRRVTFKIISFSDLNIGEKVTIYNLAERGGSTLHGDRVVVWRN